MTDSGREILFEIQDTGQFLRIAAFDVITKTEVIVMAPRSLTQRQAQTHARNKLMYVLSKQGIT